MMPPCPQWVAWGEGRRSTRRRRLWSAAEVRGTRWSSEESWKAEILLIEKYGLINTTNKLDTDYQIRSSKIRAQDQKYFKVANIFNEWVKQNVQNFNTKKSQNYTKKNPKFYKKFKRWEESNLQIAEYETNRKTFRKCIFCYKMQSSEILNRKFLKIIHRGL